MEKIFQKKKMISKEDYERLKPYYDFQRKKEYNREQLMFACSHVAGEDTSSFFELMWSQFDEKDYQEPPSHWVPKNPQWQIEGEGLRNHGKKDMIQIHL